MKPGENGTSLTCGPYVTLARKAVPEKGFGELNNLTLSQWLDVQGLEPIVKK